VVMHECHRKPHRPESHGYMDGYSVHYYVGVEKGRNKGS
jgi:alpha-N-arabinofuranosidase